MSRNNSTRPLLSEIAVFEAGDPNDNPWVFGVPKIEAIEVVPYDSKWPELFLALKTDIETALAENALTIEHVGSTAVPGLAAKPVVDIDLIVDNPDEEALYVPALEAMGYTLTVRERSWYQHRMLRFDSPRVNLHVFGPNCPEHIRHILFRDWLCSRPEDRQRYAMAKALAKNRVDNVQSYNENKRNTVEDIYRRIFEFYGLRESDSI
ncbi:GrpB family protein [Burkholderia lata]|uniref:GrpB family protein n=1 Tax=Burkholderia lata (strain ATCC 17760 / DSM 23089 / LMG 22485 / NCIMB 9086 / R18194 / 383) TaxID=482957 RepID=UPI001582A580|nr:GrpB family protein [Burkholderia lata]